MRAKQTARPFITGIAAISTVFLIMGCSASPHRVHSTWLPPDKITVDGHEDDWVDTPPQYYDEESRVSVRTMNNDDSLFVCATVGSRHLSRHIMNNGLTLTLGLDENEIEKFALVIKPRNVHNNPIKPNHKQASVPTKTTPRGVVDITYPNPTVPETMSSAEARENGIDAFMQKNKYGQVVFEANLTLDAIALLRDIKPDTRVTVEIESSGPETPKKQISEGRSGRGGGGGRKGGKGGKGDRGAQKNINSFKAQLDVTLARTLG